MLKPMTILALAALAATPALAQQNMQGMDHSKMQGMDHSKMQGMDHSKMDMSKMDMKGPYGKASMDMCMKMMGATGDNAAETYTRKLIEHHRGALAMSQIALGQSQDAHTRITAQKVIAAQTREIADLQAWLRSQGKRAQ